MKQVCDRRCQLSVLIAQRLVRPEQGMLLKVGGGECSNTNAFRPNPE